MISILILSFSSLFQFLTALVALWNIKITGKKISWMLISLATILMGSRRMAPLYNLLVDGNYSIDIFNEIIGLILSLTFLLGVIGIRYIFIERILYSKQIEKLYNEKKVLLKEVHHRIKNNMNVIRSLLSMRSQSLGDPEALKVFQDAIARIESMGVLYDKLYKTENYQNVSIKDYISQLIDEIFLVFPDHENIRVEKDMDDVIIGTETVFSLGIIVNELLTNAMKYAFTGRNSGVIKISAKKKESNVIVVFEDNGVGITDEIKQKGFGFTLVALLVEQIGGTYVVENNNGTKFVFKFKI